MMGRQIGDQTSLFYEFRLDDRIPKGHLLRRINVFLTPVLDSMHEQLAPYYSEIGRPSIDPELMVRMLIVGCCYGLRSERKLTQEVELHLAYRWFCRLDLDNKVSLSSFRLLVSVPKMPGSRAMFLPLQYAWFEPVLIATIVVFIIDLVGNSIGFGNRVLSAIMSAIVFALVFGTLVYFGYGSVSMSVTTTPSATSPAQTQK